MWKKCKLSDIGTIVGGATPSTTVDKYYGGDILWLTPKDLSSFSERYIERGERNITSEGLKSCSAQVLPTGSVLFSSRAPIGYIAIAKNPIATNQGFKSIIPNEYNDSLFLYYLLKFNKTKIEAMGSGTTFKEVSGATMKNIEVFVPPLKEQRRIAGILGALDDKIECNNRINWNLEEQAAALFRRWFVDFEFPNSDGNPYRSGGGTMQDSLFGHIPSAWQVGPLGDYIDTIDNRGKTPPLENSITNFPIIDVKALASSSRTIDYNSCTKYVNQETYNNWFRNGHPKQYDILISTVGSLAEMKLFYGSKGCVAQNVVGFRAKNISPLYLFEYLKYIKNDLVSYNIGSVQPSIKVTHIIKHKIIIPHIVIADKFETIINEITSQIHCNEIENQTLAILRDTLLPKLMNNEIKV